MRERDRMMVRESRYLFTACYSLYQCAMNEVKEREKAEHLSMGNAACRSGNENRARYRLHFVPEE